MTVRPCFRLTSSPPRAEISWRLRAHKNELPVHSVLQDSALVDAMPHWDDISLTWKQLAVWPTRWKSVLSQWRGIYYIFDASDCKGYVGSAYGYENLFGRWMNYSASGHGGILNFGNVTRKHYVHHCPFH